MLRVLGPDVDGHVPVACVAGALRSSPAAPANFTATGTCTGVTLTWDAVPDTDQSSLYRGGICGTAVDTFGNVTSPHVDATAAEGITYLYWIQAVNFCGASLVSGCASGQRLIAPVPAISGLSMNTCPDLTVTLTTEAGHTDYQWFKSGLPIPGANASTYEVTESDAYTVSYKASNGCTGISAPHGVIIYECGPPVIVYQS